MVDIGQKFHLPLVCIAFPVKLLDIQSPGEIKVPKRTQFVWQINHFWLTSGKSAVRV
jgi:hypothetical protein